MKEHGLTEYGQTCPEKKEKRESGLMVVEAAISFTAFILVTVAIIYLINIFAVHNKVQYAINSAAQEIASYSYLYQATGLRSASKSITSDGSSYTGSIDDLVSQITDTLNSISTLSGQLGTVSDAVGTTELNSSSLSTLVTELGTLKDDASSTVDSVKSSASKIRTSLQNPQDILVGIIYLGVSGGTYLAKSAFASAAASLLCEGFLTQGSQDADAYLSAYGVVGGYGGLDFSGSTIFCDSDERVVDIVVEYDLDLGFLTLVLGSGATLHMVQRVSVLGWVDGDGQAVK